MDSTLPYLVLNRQVGLGREMAAIANNVANMATTGYRREGLIFAEHVHAGGAARDAGPFPSAISAAAGGGAFADSLSMADLAARFPSGGPGEQTVTGGQLDVAIIGRGFFTILSDGEALLTRAGAFQRSPEGLLVTPEGAQVLDNGGASIFLPPQAARVEIGRDGTISADGQPLAQLGLVDAPAATLSRAGLTAFRSAGQPVPVEAPQVRQGALEGSNVNPIGEVARMITVLRAYEQAQNLAETADERSRETIRRLGQPV